ncbi:DUF4435 domain-containing protein [Pasteurella multocida]
MCEDLEYSIDALNTLSDFYEVNYVIFVEDKDDEFFWRKIFDFFLSEQYKFEFRIEENVTGCKILDKKIEDVKNGLLNSSILIARDSDYLDFKKEKIEHDRVLYTYGHSIENCLFSENNLNRIIDSYSRGIIRESDIAQWLSKIKASVEKLIKLDILSQVNGYGIEILRKSCDQFVSLDDKTVLDDNKINSKINEVQERLGYTININDEMEKLGNIQFYYLRGHFFVSLISNFIRKRCSMRSLPIDALMSSAFMSFQDSLQEEMQRYNYYSELCGKLC